MNYDIIILLVRNLSINGDFMNEIEMVENVENINVKKDNVGICYKFIQRTIDIISGLVGVIFLIPLTIFIKIAYVLSGDFHSIFFAQVRIGKDGKKIKIYKYRSMIVNADEALEKLLKEDEEARREYKRYKKLKNDPRVTKVGKFIRKTSFDEFPQFLNVLKGDMSLVGPRPYLHREIEDMGEYYDTIIKCKPGVTGYWQVNGRSATDFGNRLVMDEYYYNHRTILLNIKIIIKTFIQIFFKKGV